jgi:hypothetical protein
MNLIPSASDDHVLDFLDVLGFCRFGPLAPSPDRVPFKDAGDPVNGRVAFTRSKEIILYPCKRSAIACRSLIAVTTVYCPGYAKQKWAAGICMKPVCA